MAYLTLFGWSFLAATLVPVGSEPALIVLVRRGHAVIPLVLVATFGNYLGASTTYVLARVAVQAISREEPGQRTRVASRWIEQYGGPALLLSWVPLIGDAIVAAAGAARMRFAVFSTWTAIGKLARYIAVAWVAARW